VTLFSAGKVYLACCFVSMVNNCKQSKKNSGGIV